jgi:6,7-dimethyl-8-ribityllumazine synthase
MRDPSWKRNDVMKLGIVVSEFNYDITYLMEKKAQEHAELLGAETEVVKVPGVFDTPLAVKFLLERNDIDGVAVIGAVIKGETKHDDLVINQAVRKLVDHSDSYNKPVTLGIIGPGATHEQAVERMEEYSSRAVESLVKMLRALKSARNIKK